MEPQHKNIQQLGEDLDRRLLEIAVKVDPEDEQAIDMYAAEITMDFCRAGFRDIAANLQAVNPDAVDQDFSKFADETMPSMPFYQENFAGIKRQIYDTMKAIGKSKKPE